MDIFDLSGKVAVITGGNGGLGLGMAKALAQAGADICIVARNEEKSAKAAQNIKSSYNVDVITVKADISKENEIEAAVYTIIEHHNNINILINNAGTSIRGAVEDLNRSDFEFVVGVNVTAALRFSQLLYPFMKKRGSGKIINIGSLFSNLGSSFSLPYAVTKGGLIQLTQSLAVAWAKDNIQVNAIIPGWFETELTEGTRKHMPDLVEKVNSGTPAGRWGKPEDLSGTAIFLASPASNFITGASICVDGGYSISI